MRIAQINSVCGRGSTGKICVGISELLDRERIENRIFYFSGMSMHKNAIKCSADKYVKLQALKSRIFGNYGFNSNFATSRLIKKLKHFSPDIVHIHNVHGHDINLARLLKFLEKEKIKLVWTFHDCWAFTGYCTYFSLVKCEKWETECSKCPQKRKYTWLFDRSKELHNRKKKLLENMDLVIVTPSQWLADLVKKSFLGEKQVKVINNGIDLNVFTPTPCEEFSVEVIPGKTILGVADGWGPRKGLETFIELACRLGDEYRIILVGTNDDVDKLLPENIISVHKTQNQKQLAEIYSLADLFVNPTKEEVFGMVNIEALACGTPVITYRTGGSPESIDDSCGCVVEYGDIDTLEKEIRKICTQKPYSSEACLQRANAFGNDECFIKYIRLYKDLQNSNVNRKGKK